MVGMAKTVPARADLRADYARVHSTELVDDTRKASEPSAAYNEWLRLTITIIVGRVAHHRQQPGHECNGDQLIRACTPDKGRTMVR
jgi:hypothetical protein